MHPAILLLIVLLLIVLACLIAVKFFGAKFGGKIFEDNEDGDIEYGIMNVALDNTHIANDAYKILTTVGKKWEDVKLNNTLYFVELAQLSANVPIDASTLIQQNVKYSIEKLKEDDEFYKKFDYVLQKNFKTIPIDKRFKLSFLNVAAFKKANTWFEYTDISHLYTIYHNMNAEFNTFEFFQMIVKTGAIDMSIASTQKYINYMRYLVPINRTHLKGEIDLIERYMEAIKEYEITPK